MPDLFNDALRFATGYGYDELSNRGRAMYPTTAPGSAHHRLASQLFTENMLKRFGRIPYVGEGISQAIPQALGLGVEGAEAIGRALGGGSFTGHLTDPDTGADLAANAQGSQDALESYRRSNAAPYTGSSPSSGSSALNQAVAPHYVPTTQYSQPSAPTATSQTASISVGPSPAQLAQQERQARRARQDSEFFDQYSAANPNPAPRTGGSGYVPGRPSGSEGIEEYVNRMFQT